MYGFKSFAPKTQMVFNRSVCILMGPNGCGKSNVFDAIRWVIGEQRLSLLRTSILEEVIFNGSVGHKPLNFAEVSIELEDAKGLIPFDPTAERIRITRKVYREGESHFSINGIPVRLKDIRSVLSSVGLGDVGYAVIEQSMIGKILGGSSIDRRMLFEQAAGVAHYKQDRHLTEQKLNSTILDLSRLEDIIEEVEQQEIILRRQVKRTRNYKKLVVQKTEISKKILAGRIAALISQKKDKIEELESERKKFEKKSSQLASLRAELQSARAARDDLETKRSNYVKRLSECEKKITQNESSIKVLEERVSNFNNTIAQDNKQLPKLKVLSKNSKDEIVNKNRVIEELQILLNEIQKRNEVIFSKSTKVNDEILSIRKLLKKLENKNDELMQLQAKLENYIGFAGDSIVKLESEKEQINLEYEELKKKIGLTEKEMTKLETKREKLTTELKAIHRSFEETEFEREECQLEIEKIENEIETMNNKASKLEGSINTIQDIFERRDDIGKGIKAIIDNKSEFNVVGVLADLIYTENPEVVERILERKTNFVVVETYEQAQKIISELEDESGDIGFVILSELTGHSTLGGWFKVSRPELSEYLENVEISDDFSLDNSEKIVVSEDGKVLRKRGELQVAKSPNAQGPLILRKKFNDFNRELEKLKIILAKKQTELSDKSCTLTSLESRIDEIIEKQDEIAQKENEIGHTISLNNTLVSDWLKRLEYISQKRKSIDVQIDDTKKQAIKNERELANVRLERKELSELIDAKKTQMEELEIQSRSLEKDSSAIEFRKLSLENEIRNARKEIERLEFECKNADKEISRLIDEITNSMDGVKISKSGMSKFAEEIENLFQSKSSIEKDLEVLAVELNSLDNKIKKLSSAERETELDRDELSKSVSTFEQEISQIKGTLEELDREAVEEFDELMYSEQLSKVELIEFSRKLEKIKRRIEQIGGVNLEAEEQYGAVKNRNDFLKEQKSDITTSISDLRKTIEQLDSEAKRLFLETFEAGRQRFQEIFSQLFEDGEADLELEKKSEPLESDILIKVRPAGKKTLTLSQLSAGEKALTSIALLFGLYLVKPAPFCLMDEVDAPLDDVNIKRFLKLIRHFSDQIQFLIVSHNKITLSKADYIYGISMEQDGISRIISLDPNRYNVEVLEQEA